MILNGWKEIANYIGRGVRTVQRWEGLGLPVRRPNARLRSAVFTESEELDRWLAGCGSGRPGACAIEEHRATNPELIVKLTQAREQMQQLRAKMHAFHVRSATLQLEAANLLTSINGRFQERKDVANAA